MEAARDAWLESPEVAAIVEAMAAFGEGLAIERLPLLGDLIDNHRSAGQFVQRWCDAMVGVMRSQRLGLVPFRYNCTNGFTSVRLASVGCVSLSLLAYEERAAPITPSNAVFADRALYEVVLAGKASGLVHRLDPPSPAPIAARQEWRAGDCIQTLGMNQARQVVSVSGRFSLLQLARENPSAAPTRQVSLESGELRHSASGDKRESQKEMALAVLEAMQRRDAVPAIAQLAHEGSAHLRWQAVRHAIALDPQRGFSLLSGLASASDDALAMPARELHRQLGQAYPQLLEQELEPCLN